MISALPIEPDRDLYCVPVGCPRRERGWAIGSQIITITDQVSDETWLAVAQRTYLKRGAVKRFSHLVRDRYPVVMFRSLDKIHSENCVASAVRYYDQLRFVVDTFRNTPALARGVNRVHLIKQGKYWRNQIDHDVVPWEPLAIALIALNKWVDDNMPPSSAITPECIEWVKRRNYFDLAQEFNARVEGPR